MKEVNFIKAVASGNDFIIIDKSKLEQRQAKSTIVKLAKQLCQRKISVGADGLLVIEPSKRADFKMRIFNPDGTEVDMCGNGSRCVALYAYRNKIIYGKKMIIETGAGDLEAQVKTGQVKVKMPSPKNLRLKFDLDISGQTQNLNYINTGVPHVVCFAQRLNNFDLLKTGKAIRYHSEFQPHGTNADFVEILDKADIRVRTYERGVEQETLACGTGAVAAAVITTYQMQQQPQGSYKIKVRTKSGEILTVYFNITKDIIDKVYLEGKAEIVYRGKFQDQ